MNNICIIPARGGSKRILKKNIKEFIGKPIIAYSIEAAIKSNLFDIVMVSTDSEEIAEISRNYGAEVPFMRSEINSNDYATTFDVIEEVLLKYKKDGISFKNTCCLYSCAPFVTAKLLTEANRLLMDGKFESVFPIVKYGHPIQRALKKTNVGGIEMFETKYLKTRSQDLKECFHDVGMFYYFKTEQVLSKKNLWTDNTFGLEISAMESQDIDDEIDWKLAELKYKLLNE